MDVAANVLAGGKNSRLYKRLVYDLQIAQNVSAFQSSKELGSEFCIIATELDKLEIEGPTQREVDRTVNGYEASFLDRLERIGGFGGKSDALNGYYFRTGNPDYFNEDMARYRAVSVDDVTAMIQTYLRDNGRVVLSVVPEGRPDLAATKTTSE